MAEDFRQREDGDDNQKDGRNRNDIVGENKRLTWRVLRGWRTRRLGLRLRLRSRRRSFGAWDWQLGRGDGGNGRERDRQRRNGLRGSGSEGGGIEARGNFGNGPAAARIAAEGVAGDVEKGLRKRVGDERVGRASGLGAGNTLGEGFDQGHAQRP